MTGGRVDHWITAAPLEVALRLAAGHNCSKPHDAERATPKAAPASNAAASTSAPAQRCSARGTVRSIDVDQSPIWIAHEELQTR